MSHATEEDPTSLEAKMSRKTTNNEADAATVKRASIPRELRKLSRWGCWKHVAQGERITKPPFDPKSGRFADPTKPETWSPFSTAFNAYREGDYEGISFFLSTEDDIVGIDLDDCRKPNRNLRPWATEIVASLNSYTEVSPSGRGLRIFLRGKMPGNKGRHKGDIEAYPNAKALTVTGHRLRNLPATIEHRQAELDAFLADHFPAIEEGENDDNAKGDLLKGWSPKAANEPNAAKLKALFAKFKKAKPIYEGDLDNYNGDQSAAEQGLANYAAACRWPAREIADLLVTARRKASGEDAKHHGYYEATIKSAFKSKLVTNGNGKASPLPFTPPIPLRRVPSSVARPRTLQDAKAVFNKWLYLEDDSIVDLMLGLLAGNRLPTDSIWLYLVAPPSSGKTELLNSIFDSEETYFISDLTPAALISGYVDPTSQEDMSLLPKLDGKLVVIKDFTVILSKPAETRNQLYGILRDAYDGYSCRSMGTGTKGYKSRFNLIAGVTPEIEAEWSRNTPLGERFLTYRLTVQDRAEHTRRSLLNANNEPIMRQELRDTVQGVLAGVRDVIPSPDAVIERTLALADLLTTARTFLERDRNGCVMVEPSPELAGRVAKQLLRVGQSLALVRGKKAVDNEDFAVMRRIALDSLPSYRRSLLCGLRSHDTLRTSKYFATKLRGSEKTLRTHLEDLFLLGLAERETVQGNRIGYRLNDRTRGLFKTLEA